MFVNGFLMLYIKLYIPRIKNNPYPITEQGLSLIIMFPRYLKSFQLIIERSITRIPMYDTLNTIKIGTNEKTVAMIANEIKLLWCCQIPIYQTVWYGFTFLFMVSFLVKPFETIGNRIIIIKLIQINIGWTPISSGAVSP